MQLKRLELHGYRNYEHLELATGAGVNILIGPNAQGKTNLLEAIHVLALTKSHRTSKDKELIGWNQPSARIRAELERKHGAVELELQLSPQGKRAKVNGLEQRKLSGFVGTVNVVLFAPEDLDIVKGAPGVRRRFMDMEIGQVHPGYLYDSQQYQRIMQQRNNYLKATDPRHASQEMLDVWNEQLVSSGVKMMQKRQNFIVKLQSWAEKIHEGITNGAERLTVEYRPSFGGDLGSHSQDQSSLFDQFMLKLTQGREQEFRRGTTLVGPHRDDLAFFINGKDVQSFGSQGQQRTTALSLKLAELELMREEIGEYPLLLLDDVLSELDQMRQTQLIETFQSRVQTFITTTGLESVNMSRLKDAAVYHVRHGEVLP
ncbi:DNA replication and repair protein RecF [Cohnella xylanilytica]|uniref:DNA replication and repair protein RecF n=1 Tax=Cohnella xylanilytica TaxID=557555 RepID=A0A841U9J1_9BACL|nr:DNA replication/repair protein RecF [Cohnella xylanilytica]MBB6694774.1 DNA replication/repair protein RecF [Cohnella xylanilytica]GIO11952.1 DNA replication and repair protein RecF [Cohnella xylanilytica]